MGVFVNCRAHYYFMLVGWVFHGKQGDCLADMLPNVQSLLNAEHYVFFSFLLRREMSYPPV